MWSGLQERVGKEEGGRYFRCRSVYIASRIVSVSYMLTAHVMSYILDVHPLLEFSYIFKVEFTMILIMAPK